MPRIVSKFCSVLAITLATILQFNGSALAAAEMQLLGKTSAPIGYVGFCKDNPRDCGQYTRRDLVVKLTKPTLNQLNTVNRTINAAVEPATDMDIYGVVERWAYPALKGDCEDYVLLKRRTLIQDGWPASALLVTVVRDEVGDGHAVLTVRTNRGDLILDNKTDVIRLWSDTDYHYVKRQSSEIQNAWDMISDNRAVEVGSIRR